VGSDAVVSVRPSEEKNGIIGVNYISVEAESVLVVGIILEEYIERSGIRKGRRGGVCRIYLSIESDHFEEKVRIG
jgi:hypothetical protein